MEKQIVRVNFNTYCENTEQKSINISRMNNQQRDTNIKYYNLPHKRTCVFKFTTFCELTYPRTMLSGRGQEFKQIFTLTVTQKHNIPPRRRRRGRILLAISHSRRVTPVYTGHKGRVYRIRRNDI